MLTSIKHSVFTVGTASLLSLGTLTLASPTYAISLDLSTWDSIGDVTNSPTTLNSGTNSTVSTGGGVGSLDGFLDITPGSLDSLAPGSNFGSPFGSAIKKTFTSINAGDIFSFNWDFSTNDIDSAFVTINNSVIALTGSYSFSYNFTTAGIYNIGIGVVDVDDAFGKSTLTVSNANLQAVPEPGTMLGLLTGMSGGVGMLRRFGKKARH
jgi:hypothetical protein